MPNASSRGRRPARGRRVPRTYRLPLAKLTAAKRALGVATATETIERALELVLFSHELVEGTRSMLGVRIHPPDLER